MRSLSNRDEWPSTTKQREEIDITIVEPDGQPVIAAKQAPYKSHLFWKPDGTARKGSGDRRDDFY